MVVGKSPEWIPPPGFTEKVKYKNGRKIKVYIELSSGSKFYSRASVTRYLNTADPANTVTIKNEIDKVDEPFANLSPQLISVMNAGGTCEKKRKSNFVTVAIERATADDLPPGWIKETKTSKSGNRIRKDPYYTDPVSGYVFRSKLDALRYVKTNDIGSCACRPLKRKLEDIKLIECEISSSGPANVNLSVHKNQLFLGGESNGGGETSSTKNLAESEATSVHVDCLEGKISCQDLNKNAEEENYLELANEVSKEDINVMAVDVAICSPVTDTVTKQQHSENGSRTKVGSRKSKKRRDLNLPSRTSKRLAGCEPEMPSNLVLNEHSLTARARRSHGSEVDASPTFPQKASASIPGPSDIKPAKEAPGNTSLSVENHQDFDPLHEVETPLFEGQVIPEEQSGGKANEKQLDDSKREEESQLCYDFGDSWSDPLEFALKTLRGEISIEDTLAFPSSFNEQLSTPYNQADGWLKQSQSDAPIFFQNGVASHCESSKQNSTVDQFPPNSSSFSAPGNNGFTSCGGFNCQSSREFGKKDFQTKFNP